MCRDFYVSNLTLNLIQTLVFNFISTIVNSKTTEIYQNQAWEERRDLRVKAGDFLCSQNQVLQLFRWRLCIPPGFKSIKSLKLITDLTHQLGGNDLGLVPWGLIVGGENNTVGQEGEPQGGISSFTKLPVGLNVQGLVIGDLDLGGSCSTGDCGAELT